MQDRAGGHQYETTSWGRHLVAEYTGVNFHERGALDYVTFLAWRRDAYITRLNKTEEGREYLDNAWRMEQTKPDRQALRKKLGKNPENPKN